LQGEFPRSEDTDEVKTSLFDINPAYEKLLKANGFDSLEKVFMIPRGESLRDVPGRLTVRLNLKKDDGSQLSCYLKRHWNKKRPLNTAPHREALLEWDNIQKLRENSVPVPEGVAMGTGFINGRAVGFVMTAEVAGIPADDFIRENFSGENSLKNQSGKRKFLRQLAEYATSFHRQGYNHRDFYLCHTFVELKEGNYYFHLIDLQRVQHRTHLRGRWLIKDLSQMNYSASSLISKTDRLRFFMVYMQQEKLSQADKRFAKSILKKTAFLKQREIARIKKYGKVV